MSVTAPPRPPGRDALFHRFEFRGSGGEFFRIWIVNIALTLITLGIYSAWAKVRTRRYFYGNFYVAGHSFDYHASPWRILIGRLIAVALLAGYNILVSITPLLSLAGLALLAVAIPWLVVSSRRFNARNTSYRNVRFNFAGSYWGAFKAIILWQLAGLLSLGLLMPLAQRARDYFYVNNHSFGGKPFKTFFAGWSIYKIYLVALLLFVLALGGTIALAAAFAVQSGTAGNPAAAAGFGLVVGISFALFSILIFAYIGAKIFNLVVGNTVLDGRHDLNATLSPWQMVWIGLTNLVLILATVGLFYPWARVRVARYMADHMSLLAGSNLDEFTSEAFSTQSAIGEEIAGFFDFDIGI